MKQLPKRTSLHRLLGLMPLALALLVPSHSLAQPDSYPSRPIKLVVPFAPGGAGDLFARISSKALSERIGQSVVVENRGGAGGTIAAGLVANSPGDGYTLLVGDVGTNAIAPGLHRKLSYDAVKDFKPVTLGVSVPLFLIVHPSVKADTLQDLIALVKAKPNGMNFGSSGAGNILHLAGEMLKIQTGADIVHIPYKGGAQTVAGLLGNETQMMFVTASAGLPHIRSGKAKALAVASEKRADLLPDVPTMNESGLSGFVADSWYGVFAPAATPSATVDYLSKELRAALLEAGTRQRLVEAGFNVLATSPEEFSTFLEQELPKWSATIKAAGITLE